MKKNTRSTRIRFLYTKDVSIGMSTTGKQIGILLVGVGLGWGISFALPAPLGFLQPYLWAIPVIIGIILVIKE
jgi:hypothetical protein